MPANIRVFTQGDHGCCFYLTLKGSVSVLVKTKGASSENDDKEVKYKEIKTNLERIYMKSKRAMIKKGNQNFNNFKRI